MKNKINNKNKQDMLKQYEMAWSSQNVKKVMDFFAEDLKFEDIPIGLKASNKKELSELLRLTFESVPNFKMGIFESYFGEGFIITKWKQSGNMTANEYGLKLDNYEYESIVTSIIKINDNGLITSVSDNWDSSIFFK